MGRPKKHGAYSLIKPLAVRRYLSGVRAALVRDVGGTEDGLSAQQIILIDAVVNMLAVTRSMELHVGKFGIMFNGKVQPCLSESYLGYRNSISRHLKILGVELKEVKPEMTLEKYVEGEYGDEKKS